MYEVASTPIELTGGGKITDETELNNLKKVKVSQYSKSITITNNDNTTVTMPRGLPNSTDRREPDLVVGNGSKYDAVDTNRATAGFKHEDGTTMTLAEMAEAMVKNYEDMIASIGKYKGFYVGRYELSKKETGEVGEFKNKPTLTNTSWYALYEKCTKLNASDKVKTEMIWGSQWDMVCNFIATKGDCKNITDSSTWGNYADYNTANNYTTENEEYEEEAGKKRNTGSSENWKANNLYDIAGNCWEWTQEASNTNGRAYRGGSYVYNGSSHPASCRNNYSFPDSSNNSFGSRSTLIVK